MKALLEYIEFAKGITLLAVVLTPIAWLLSWQPLTVFVYEWGKMLLYYGGLVAFVGGLAAFGAILERRRDR